MPKATPGVSSGNGCKVGDKPMKKGQSQEHLPEQSLVLKDFFNQITLREMQNQMLPAVSRT